MSFFSFVSIKNSHNCSHVSIASWAAGDCPTFSWRCVTVTFSCRHDINWRVIWEEGTSLKGYLQQTGLRNMFSGVNQWRRPRPRERCHPWAGGLGCVRKQIEGATGSKAALFHGFCFSFCRPVPALISWPGIPSWWAVRLNKSCPLQAASGHGVYYSNRVKLKQGEC